MNKLNKILVLLSIVLITVVSVPNALAYFYTYAQTEGKVKIKLADDSEIKEDVKNQTKFITINAVEGSDPVFVRVAYFTTDEVDKKNTVNPNGWVEDGDYYYYGDPIDGKNDTALADATKKLDIHIKYPAEASNTESFNVVVVHEMTPAIFSETEPTAKYKYQDSEAGGWWYADWSNTVAPTTVIEEGE